LSTEDFTTKVLRLELNKIYASHSNRTMQTAEVIQKIYKEKLNKDLEIIKDERLWQEAKDEIKNTYQEILEKEK
jgi:phosphohistidine phosphatase SixA